MSTPPTLANITQQHNKKFIFDLVLPNSQQISPFILHQFLTLSTIDIRAK